MKKLYALVFIFIFSLTAMSQKLLPVIKAGTNMAVDVDFHGQSIVLNLNYKSLADPIMIGWDVGGTSGTYTMSAKSLENGKKFNLDQPDPSVVTLLKNDETFMCISKAAYQSLVSSKSFTYNGLTFAAKDDSDGFKLNGKPVDATYAVSADGKTSVWILNNPSMPIALNLKGNPAGVDYTVTIIE
jgi:hypothetical protein